MSDASSASDTATDQAAQPAIEIFYSYASQDEASFFAFQTYMKPLERKQPIKGWHRGLLTGGKEEQRESERHLNSAQLIVLLISPDYLASDACYAEMERAAERMQVRPMLLRSSCAM